MNQISENKDEKKKVPPPALPKQPKREKEEKVYPVMSLEEICAIIEAKCGKVFIAERHGKQERSHNHVIILPEAWEELRVMITYGRISPINEFEQQFCGYGHIFLTEEGYVTTVVSHFIQVHTMNRTPISSSYLSKDGASNPGLDFLAYYRDEYVKTGHWLFEDGRRFYHELMALQDPPTVVVSLNDEMAAGFISESMNTDRKILDKVSIVGYNGFSYCRFLYPTLATVKIPLKEIGFEATKQLIDEIQKKGCGKRRVILPCVYQDGDSLREMVVD